MIDLKGSVNECTLLSGLICSFDKMESVINIIPTEEYFLEDINKKLYKLLLKLYSENDFSDKPDYSKIIVRATAENIFESEQDAKLYIYKLAEIVSPVDNILDYANAIKQKHLINKLSSSNKNILDDAQSGKISYGDAISKLEETLHGYNQEEINDRTKSVAALFSEEYDYLQELNSEKGDELIKNLSLGTGYNIIDNTLIGLRPGNLIVLAARPGIGKTALAANIALNVARTGKEVVYFTLEMSNKEIFERLLSKVTQIPSNILYCGKIKDDESQKISREYENFKNMPLHINDCGNITLSSIKSICKSKKAKLCIIDYLQLMSIPGFKDVNRVQEISKLTRSLKVLASELNIPIILLSQLNRDIEKSGNRRPHLSDLRDSGSIEQDANSVIFLYNSDIATKTNSERVINCYIAKNRNGMLGEAPLLFKGDFCQFENYF